MSNIIQYGKKLKKTAPFFGDSSIIQQFSLQGNNILQKISIYVELNDKCNHDYYSKIIIVDQQQNLYFTKQFYFGDVYQSNFYDIVTNLKLDNKKNYFLCIDSYGSGSQNNNVSFFVGYRKKMMNFFINNKFSVGQLYFKIFLKK